MQKIDIKDVKDGMVLAESLENAHGNVLLGKGAVLTKAFASRLAQRGILSLFVEGKPGAEENEVSTVQVQANEAHVISLEKLFEGKIVNNSMQIIYEALIRHRESLIKHG